ncbi:uncharacterized protein LOC100375190 [Saccoglossus kowalevskii]|uniref:Uncharacterized protein LOC100375190 n=1 Tax=Saccoglossus kowalevskii TaxID=10224 RepID=A0ABM0GXL2_SACKO|nr:PREDICTED: uncharacterized protein LOC100375190 [Saccoglossus kowalevskii]
MVVFCCVPGCNQHGWTMSNGDRALYFSFPKDVAMRKQWFKNVRIMPSDSLTISDSSKVCCRHFTISSMRKTLSGVVRLRGGAVPTVFSWTASTAEQEENERQLDELRQSSPVTDQVWGSYLRAGDMPPNLPQNEIVPYQPESRILPHVEEKPTNQQELSEVTTYVKEEPTEVEILSHDPGNNSRYLRSQEEQEKFHQMLNKEPNMMKESVCESGRVQPTTLRHHGMTQPEMRQEYTHGSVLMPVSEAPPVKRQILSYSFTDKALRENPSTTVGECDSQMQSVAPATVETEHVGTSKSQLEELVALYKLANEKLKNENVQLAAKHRSELAALQSRHEVEEINFKISLLETEAKVQALERKRFCIEKFKDDDEAVHFYTGFSNIHHFKTGFVFFGVREMLPLCSRQNIKTLDQFFLVMCKLRLGLADMDLAERFDISQVTVKSICAKWFGLMKETGVWVGGRDDNSGIPLQSTSQLSESIVKEITTRTKQSSSAVHESVGDGNDSLKRGADPFPVMLHTSHKERTEDDIVHITDVQQGVPSKRPRRNTSK